MKKGIYVLMLLMAPLTGLSQINYSIKGKVITSDGYSPAGNVIALHPKDSSFIKGTSFFDEVFELSDLENEEILLKFSSLEFDDTFLNVKYLGNSTIDLGEVIVKSSGTSLDEVIVTARQPVYTKRIDGTVEVLIENTTLAASNSTEEILSKSPGIIAVDGEVSVFGKGLAIIYLDGKRITDDQLSLISPSNIKKIEIIRNPSSKYDAEGAAVINIATIKREDDGYQGSLRQNISYSDFGGTNTYSSLNINYKRGRFSSSGNYSLQLGQERVILHTIRNREPEDGFLTTDLTTNWENEYDNYSYYGLGAQYDINDKSFLSIKYSGFLERLGGITVSNNEIVDDNGQSSYTSNTDKDEKDANNSISLNYNASFDTLGTELFIGGQYSNFKIGANNDITEKGAEAEVASSRLLMNLLDLDIDILSAQADFTKVFKSKSKLEFGTKYSYVENDFNFDFLVSTNGSDFELDNNRSNDFYYNEAIGAVYISFSGLLYKKLNYTIGARSEYTQYNLELSQPEDQIIKDDYFGLFPNFSLSRVFSNDNTLNFSYSSRINRPPYQELNPVIIYQDRYTAVQGNPKLKPQKTQAVELNSNIKETTYTIGYNYTQNPFGQTVVPGEETNSYILKRINYDQQHEFFASISRTFTINWWTSTNSASLKYTNLTEKDLDFERVEPRPNLYFYTNNQFDILNLFNVEVMFWYLSNNYEGLHRRNSMYNLTVTLEKSFFNEHLNCRFIANDIFDSFVASGNYDVGQTAVYYNRRWTTNYFRLAIAYNFGKLKKVNYSNKAAGQSESDRVD